MVRGTAGHRLRSHTWLGRLAPAPGDWEAFIDANAGMVVISEDKEPNATPIGLAASGDASFQEFVLAVVQWDLGGGASDDEVDDAYRRTHIWDADRLMEHMDHLRSMGL